MQPGRRTIVRLRRFALIALAASATALALEAADPPPQPPHTEVVVPVIGSIVGAGLVRWRTELRIVNNQRSEMTVSLLLPTVGDDRFLVQTLAPGEGMAFHDVLSEVFGLDNVLAPLLISMTSARPAAVFANAYGQRSDSETSAQPITPLLVTPSMPTRVLGSLSFNEAFRTNIGLANLGPGTAAFTLALRRVEGRNVAITEIVLPPYSLRHFPIQQLFPLISDGDNFAVYIEAPSPNTYVYASVIDNNSSEARFVSPVLGAD
jgi:hypothetical protein